MSQVGRNDPCPCGSGKKYKKCCEQKSYLQKKKTTVLSSQSDATALKVSSVSKPVGLGGLFTQIVGQEAPSSEGSLKNKEISKGKVDSKRTKD
ncbi:MAG: SEC-C domain-containing protein [Simkaniaceae bacterium]|nr:SEC-C domain-containing protein [Simkaniaceae bacterium]